MHQRALERLRHDHRFLPDHLHGERATRRVVALTLVTMAAEIAAGTAFGSMALLADGWHMGTHAAALGIAALAYRFARRHADNPRFAFGTGKVGELAGFASAVALGVVAGVMAVESVRRLGAPVPVRYDEAMAVAVLGLAVNVVCALVLQDREGALHHHDHNLRAAYLHVLADALTSVLALAALASGRLLGWAFMDPLMGLVGAVIITRWSWGLLRDTARVLLDRDVDPRLVAEVRARVEAEADNRVADLHVWRVGLDDLAVILSVVTHHPRPPEHYKALLAGLGGVAHVTVEVNPCADVACSEGAAGGSAAGLY